jgi:hypothetical protein
MERGREKVEGEEGNGKIEMEGRVERKVQGKEGELKGQG